MSFLQSIRDVFSVDGGALGLALGGGAARGIAHIGVLKVLQEEEIPVCCVAGTSIGSIIGALFCAGKSWEEIWEISQEIRWGELVQATFSGMGLVKSSRLEKLITSQIGEIDFDELKIPLTAVAVDIVTAQPVYLTSGSVSQAVRASASIPGIFEPLVIDDRMLVDGGVADNLPTDVVRDMGAGTVLAVDLNSQSSDGEKPGNLIGVTFQTFAVLMWNTSRAGRRNADILLQPEISHIGFHDLGKAEELFAAGEKAARDALPQILRRVGRGRVEA